MRYTDHPYNLLATGKKLVGWGSGGVYDYYHGLFPLPLAYLVDNAPQAQGTSKAGLQICPPETLQQEDPQQVVVVIYSSFSTEILQQLNSYGPFTSINAPVLFCSDYRQQWQRVEQVLQQSLPQRQSSATNAFLIQGQVIPELTAKIAGVYARYYPDSLRVLSTWEGTDPKLLEEIVPLVDQVLLNAPPKLAGVQNRNLQIVSTRAGLRYCQQQGAERVLKTRSDMFVMAPDLLNQCEQLRDHYDPTACRQLGLDNRLVIPQSFTRKYLPYSPSDLAMYGSTKDLLKFWDCPLDERQFGLLEVCQSSNLLQLGVEGLPAECYFGVNFCRRLGRSANGELADSWAFYRDLFLVTDNSWFELFWPKNPHIPDSFPLLPHRETISNRFWHALLNGGSAQLGAASTIDISSQVWC